MKRWAIGGQHAPLLTGAAALVVLYALVSFQSGRPLPAAGVINIIESQAPAGLLALGMTFVVLAGGIDLSVGAVMSLASVALAALLERHHWPLAGAAGLVLLGGAATGAAMGAIIHWTRLPAFIVTLAGMFIARGLGFVISLEPIAISSASHAWLRGLKLPVGVGALPASVVVLLGATIAGWGVLRFTVLGRWIRALGGNEEACRWAGVPTGRVRVAAYGASGLCAALAGITLTLYLASGSHQEGVGLELDAIAATVIGGTLLTGGVGSPIGTLLGVVTLGLVRASVTDYSAAPLSSGATKILIAALLLGFVLVQRAGQAVFGRSGAQG